MQSSPLRSLIAWSFRYYNQVIASYSSFKMPRVTRSSQKQIDFPCRKTRSQQKEIEGAIETSQSNPTRACSVSPRKRHDPVKGKLKTFALLYSTSIQPQIRKRVLTNVAMPNTTLLLKFLNRKSTYSSYFKISRGTWNQHISRAANTALVGKISEIIKTWAL